MDVVNDASILLGVESTALVADAGVLLAGVGFLAFLVSLVTEVLKSVSLFNKIPTDLLVIVLSVVLTFVAAVAYADYTNYTMPWYSYAGTIMVGMVVAFVAMYGWDKMRVLYSRFDLKGSDNNE